MNETAKAKTTKNIVQITHAKNALTELLKQKGIPRKKAYLIGRNWEFLDSITKKWNKKVHEIYMKHSSETSFKYVEAVRYNEFKREIFAAFTTASPDKLSDVFKKYEVDSPPRPAIAPHAMEAFNKEMNEEVVNTNEEFEYFPIIVDQVMEIPMKNLIATDNLAIEFMTITLSPLAVTDFAKHLI
jgi:hypothetical protein